MTRTQPYGGGRGVGSCAGGVVPAPGHLPCITPHSSSGANPATSVHTILFHLPAELFPVPLPAAVMLTWVGAPKYKIAQGAVFPKVDSA